MQSDLFVFKQGQNNNFPRETVMAALDCQYDYIWYSLKSKQLHTPIRDFFLIKSFDMGRSTFKLCILKWKDPHLIGAMISDGKT